MTRHGSELLGLRRGRDGKDETFIGLVRFVAQIHVLLLAEFHLQTHTVAIAHAKHDLPDLGWCV